MLKNGKLFCLGALVLTMPGAFATSTFSINPTFGASITSDPNAASIEATINAAISIYDSTLAVPGPNPVTANIDFEENTTGLGESNTSFDTVSYTTYCTALQTFGTLGSGTLSCGTDPVNGATNQFSGNINLKAVDDRALGLGDASPLDGTITLNTTITNPGSPGSSGAFPLQPVVEHEIDEVLGLGSGIDNVNSTSATITSTNGPFAEDLFRFAGAGTLVFNSEVGSTCDGSGNPQGTAYFSTDGGNTNLAGFNNTCNGGDWGDWDSAAERVQDAFADGSNPSLGVEFTALEAVGFSLQSSVPEPATFGLAGIALAGLALLRRRK